MIATIAKHIGMLTLCFTVPFAITFSPLLVRELSAFVEKQKSKKPVVTYTVSENTLLPTLAENAEYRKEHSHE